MRQAF